MQLRCLQEKDVDGMLEWMHDVEVYSFFRFPCEHTDREHALNFIYEAQQEFELKSNLHYAIVNDEDEYLGTISLKDIDSEALTAEFAISMRTVAQGKGIATKATKKILEIAFNELGLNRIYLNVLSDNVRAVHLYEKCGFVYEGEFREHLKIRGELKSLKWFSMLKSEYEKMGEG